MWVCDTKQCVTRRSWRGESGVRSPRSNSSARRPKRKSTNTPGSANGSFTRLGWTSQLMRLGSPVLGPAQRRTYQRPFAADFSEPQDANATIIGFGFNVAIVGSVPLIDHFDDAN